MNLYFDIGANVGSYTAFIKNNIPKSRIYSFEPQKMLFNMIWKI